MRSSPPDTRQKGSIASVTSPIRRRRPGVGTQPPARRKSRAGAVRAGMRDAGVKASTSTRRNAYAQTRASRHGGNGYGRSANGAVVQGTQRARGRVGVQGTPVPATGRPSTVRRKAPSLGAPTSSYATVYVHPSRKKVSASEKPAKRSIFPGWALIVCGCLFLMLCVVLVLAGEALLTSKQVVVGQLRSQLAAQQALRNDLSTEVGLLGQPDHLLSRALAAGASENANASARTRANLSALPARHVSASASIPRSVSPGAGARPVQQNTSQKSTPQKSTLARGTPQVGTSSTIAATHSAASVLAAGHASASQGRSKGGGG
ncbi:MAG: hypothetical protein ACYDGY_10085 [Acidimicrobiales bacterium]